MLVQLARIDGVVVQEEIKLIKQIGKTHGMSNEEISEAFEDPSGMDDLNSLDADERYEFLYNVIQVMKIDGRVYKEEIQFCTKLAQMLGYEEDVVGEMMVKIYRDPNITSDKQTLKNTVQTYLKK